MCPPLAPGQACELHQAFLLDIWHGHAALGADRLLALADSSPSSLDWLKAQGVENITGQRGRDLGERMFHAFADAFAAGSGPAVIIGSDAPAMPAQSIATAFECLQSNPAVLGPAADGGYVLIGLHVPPQAAWFETIDWGTDRVFRQQLERLEQGGIRACVLPPQEDVDHFAELLHLDSRLRGLPDGGLGAAPRTVRLLESWSREGLLSPVAG
ncbi:MAG: hypothetical protein GMKNLPBB_00173 [Myxococcota bacterium]|nr:hypothetical protein [Myxococcota bacterium]